MLTQAKTANSASEKPTLEELLGRARQLRPILMERAEETETNGRVSSDTTALLKSAQLLRLWQPKRFGGFEFGPSAVLRLGFELGRGCGSTAWCATIANSCALASSNFPIELQHELWDEDGETVVCGVVIPTGKCTPVEGGFEVEGRWGFASNCDNSDWIFVSARLPAAEGAPVDQGIFMIPRAQMEIDPLSWQVAGMQGTGSKTVQTKAPTFVPDHRTIRLSSILNGTAPGRKVPGNIMTSFNFPTFSAISLVAPMLGMAQGALEWFQETMKTKTKSALKPGAPVPIAQTQDAQVALGSASAAIDSAMTLLVNDLDEAEIRIRAGEVLSVADRVRIRRDIGFAVAQSCAAVNALMESSGASAMSSHSLIQRNWRNINVAARHMHLDVPAIYALVGQERFGLEPAGAF